MKPLHWILFIAAILLIVIGTVALSKAPKRKMSYYKGKSNFSKTPYEGGINYKASTKVNSVIRASSRY